MAPTVPGEGAAEQDEDRAVVDEAVQEHDGRPLAALGREGKGPGRGGGRRGGRFGRALRGPPLPGDAGGVEEHMPGEDHKFECGGLEQRG